MLGDSGDDEGRPAIERVSSREVYANAWLRVREDEVRYADGSLGIYSVVDKPSFVVVLPFEDDGFWLVQQFRYPVGSRQWEFPQGAWPPGGTETGSPEELAVAELAEETGFRAGQLTHLGCGYASYGFSSQPFDVFLATDLTPGAPNREATESDMVHEWCSRRDLDAMIRRSEFTDAQSLAALALFDRR